MEKEMIYKNGEKHGLINSVANSVPDNDFKHMTPENKAKAQKLRKEESKMVKARYLNHRGSHERLSMPYCRWAGDPINTYHLIPGEIYELPMGLINQINNNPGLPKRSELLDANGRPTLIEGVAEKIHEMVPVGF